jgi:D-alanine-D-alanine ligase
MDVKKVRIIFNDDGTDKFELDGEEVEFGDIRENVVVIRKALESTGIEVTETPLTEETLKSDEFMRELRGGDEDLVFNLCEGAFGNAALEMNVAAMLELYSIPFTGNGAMTLGVSLNKDWTKSILKGAGVPIANHIVADDTPVELPEDLNFPLIVKPLSEDASYGIETNSVVNTMEELDERVEYILDEFCQPAMVEEYIDGREFNLAIIGSEDRVRALPPSEIDFSEFPEGLPKICSYEAKWIEESPLYMKSPPVCPANVTEELAEALEDTALEAFEALGCRDYARIDMRQGADGVLRVLEVNPNPDISTDAGLARAARSVGLSYDELIIEIIASAAYRYFEDEEECETHECDTHECDTEESVANEDSEPVADDKETNERVI